MAAANVPRGPASSSCCVGSRRMRVAAAHHALAGCSVGLHCRAPTGGLQRQVESQRGAPSYRRVLAGCAAVRDSGRHETIQEAKERRLRESAQVESRVTYVADWEELRAQLVAAGDNLVVLEVQSDDVCESGVLEPELHWRQDQRAAAEANREACRRIKHSVQRTARECDNVVFLEMHLGDDETAEALKERLGVVMVPTLQFIRQGRVLWQDQGWAGMEQDMGEAVMYYGNQAGGGNKATDYVPDLLSRQQLHDFIHSAPSPDTLVVLDVSTTICKPCIKIYPAVLALARSFQGHAQFGRLLGDESPESEALLTELGILEVPTFLFYRGGREVGRLVSSNRGDLIGYILELQAAAGIKPPPPPPRAAAPRRRSQAAIAPANRWR